MSELLIGYIDEPHLEFANHFEHEDSKTGLALYGPYGKSHAGLHPQPIRVGIVGPPSAVDACLDLFQKLAKPIESKVPQKGKETSPFSGHFENPFFDDDGNETIDNLRSRYNKILHRDFDGFSLSSCFASEFVTNERWNRRLNGSRVTTILKENEQARMLKMIDYYVEQIESITSVDPTPNVIMVLTTQTIEDKTNPIQVHEGYFLNFRRILKARAMNLRSPVPTQIIRERTLKGGPRVQELSTRAWNLTTALYYKAKGVPWRPKGLDADTCYVGVSFYINRGSKGNQINTSLCQAFDFLGQGLVLRGDEFHWDRDKHGKTPHLTTKAAENIITKALTEYISLTGTTPKRVVVHKESIFWGSTQLADHDEIAGFQRGVKSVYEGINLDLVCLQESGIRLIRQGIQPPARGTHFCLNGRYFLYTMGYVPFLKAFPSAYVPRPLALTQYIGDQSIDRILTEILTLTKMNVNNSSYADGTPITLAFASKIGEIMKHISKDDNVHPHYAFYM